MTSILQGLQFGMRCLAQLTATQYAASVNQQQGSPMKKHHHTPNQGKILLFCSLERSLVVVGTCTFINQVT